MSERDALRNAAAEARKEIPHDTKIRDLIRDTERCREALAAAPEDSEVAACRRDLDDLEAGLATALDAQRTLEEKLDALKVTRETPG